MAAEVLSSGSLQVEMVVAQAGWLEEHGHLLRNVETVVPVEAGELKKISLLTTPNQVLLVAKQPDLAFDKAAVSAGTSLFLDDVRDPGNMGTILRIADWFGVKWVFCSQDCVEVFNPKVVQASMGAFLRVKSLEISFEALKAQLPDLPVYGTVLDGASIFSEKPVKASIIAIGNESKGLSPGIQDCLTHRISIPKGEGGGAESLNAAVATGIVCAFFAAGT